MKQILLVLLICNFLHSSVVVDTKNNLMWQDEYDNITKKLSWNEAKKYCKELSLNNFEDWYLPSIQELISIIDRKNTPSISNKFKNVETSTYWSTNSSAYWSATKFATGTSKIWYVTFFRGETSYYNKDYLYTRCVRKIK